ncbi:MAG TPA: hypothetical protein VFC56_06405 [Stellaceae bacterium]|nr:hypothetical protein [Stellaceae bacterium]
MKLAAAAGENVVGLRATKNAGFIPIPRRAARTKMRGQTRALLEGICEHTKLATGECWRTDLDSLAEQGGIVSRNLSRHLRELEGLGLIRLGPEGSIFVVYDQHTGDADQHTGDADQHTGVSRASIEEQTLHTKVQTSYTQRVRARETDLVIDQEGTEVEPPELQNAFERFWTASPHRPDDSKGRGRREWDKLIAQGVDPELVIAAAERRATTVEKPKYVRHTWKWLADREFEDQESAEPLAYATGIVGGGHSQDEPLPYGPTVLRDRPPDWISRRSRFLTGEWLDDWGPAPGEPDCQMPSNLIFGSGMARRIEERRR